MQFIDEFRKTHKTSLSSRSAPLQPADRTVDRVHDKQVNCDWQFVDAYREEKGKDMDWNTCFELGKEKGLFKKYSKVHSEKSAYFRAKR
ncbi:hypothetical protein BDA99DRAFT_431648 [Phascolomyces articulosus]|uniref:Uncharacterized protein n=1 Tax=Phascolomyces articulosus TaxID=60185 RepID=A0AAD5K861_9FUNG|nr:hypothetical protein BDA99DRAFT_431648 [Phascolomyces articulosus]